MRGGVKLVVWLLLASVIALPVAAQLASPATTGQSSGCDEHGKTTPAPSSNYACCQAGHDTAALQETFRLPDLAGNFISNFDSHTAAVNSSGETLVPAPLLSASPPFIISLRI